MRRAVKIFTLASLIPLLLVIQTVFADTYKGEASFSINDFVFTQNRGFDLVSHGDAGYVLEPGAPSLPVFQINVALPPGARVQDLQIINTSLREVEGRYDLMPAGTPQRLSDPPSEDVFTQNPAIYGQDKLYPGSYGKVLSSWDLVGQDFVSINLHPMQYQPESKTLFLAEKISFKINYQIDPNHVRTTYNFSRKLKDYYLQLLQKMSFNPAGVSALPAYVPPMTLTLDPGNYEYVIITPASFINSFQPLADWRTQMGMPAKIVDRDWIYANYSGASDREKIKNFVRDANLTWGSLYFLLGGDTKYIPYHEKDLNNEWVPNDTYYARLNLEPCSWMCNVYVGRACVNNTTQINNFVNKVLDYEKSPPSSFGDKVFLMGFDLDSNTPGEELKKLIDDYWVPAYSVLVTEYDSEPGGHEADVKAYINDGQNLINHCDHCNTDFIGTGSGGLNGSEAQQFTNGDKLSNFYTLGCWAGNYPSTCWGEYFCNDDQGGITFVGNSRYGWYSSGNPSAYSGHYDKLWWRAIFSNYNAYRAGETLAVSKNLLFPADTIYRYIFTELTLIGDPGLHMWTKDPANLTVTHPQSTGLGFQDLIVTVAHNGSDLEGALVCLMKGNETYAYAKTNSSGEAILNVEPLTTGDILVTVTAQNFKHYEGDIQVTQVSPVITGIQPNFGVEAGMTFVTITGQDFSPATNVTINNMALISPVLNNSATITGQTPLGVNGWADVKVSSPAGNSALTEGFRYFPVGNTPFNGTDIRTDSMDTPAQVTLIASGVANQSCLAYLSFGPGPQNTPYGIVGLDFPWIFLFTLNLGQQGFASLTVPIKMGFGPLDLYVHFLGVDSSLNPMWSYGGENPNGSGSIKMHLNN